MVCGEMRGRLLSWRVQRTLKATSPWKPSQVPSPTHTTLDLAWSRIQWTASLVPITSPGCTFCGPEPEAGEVDGSYYPCGGGAVKFTLRVGLSEGREKTGDEGWLG